MNRRRKWIALDSDACINNEATLVAPKAGSETSALKTSYFSKNKRNENLLEKLTPKTIGELAVHIKKINEVELWLQNNVLSAQNQAHSPILLLTGPTGSGKTATVNVLCKTSEIELIEWVNPVDQDFEVSRGLGQTARFSEFFTEAKYAPLCGFASDRKIVLVEDFPNSVIHNPGEFADILEKCYNCGRYAVIFICTDASTKGIDLAQTLFTQELREKFLITNISFNPSSATLLRNALKRAHTIVQENLEQFRLPAIETVEAIISTTMGDIRCAMNQYHFACLKGTANLPTTEAPPKPKGPKRKSNLPKTTLKHMGKNETLGLFHGLGRVLNPKLKQTQTSWRLDCDLESLIDEFSLQPRNFNSFLFENYLKYFGDLEDASKAAEIMSQSENFLEQWTDRHETLLYALWLSVLGFMVNNNHKVSMWNQIRGPTKVKKVIDNNTQTRHICATDHSYYNIITQNKTYHSFDA